MRVNFHTVHTMVDEFMKTRLKGRFAALTLACRAQVRPLRGPYVARLPGVYEILRRPPASMKREHCTFMNIIKESVVFTVLNIYFFNDIYSCTHV